MARVCAIPRRRPARRGAQTVELALSLPIFVVLTSGVTDWGWYFWRQAAVEQATQVAARSGAGTDVDDDPETTGEAAAADALTAAGLDPSTATITCTLVGADPELDVTCVVSIPFTELVGLAPTLPDAMVASVTMRLEDQSS